MFFLDVASAYCFVTAEGRAGGCANGGSVRGKWEIFAYHVYRGSGSVCSPRLS